MEVEGVTNLYGLLAVTATALISAGGAFFAGKSRSQSSEMRAIEANSETHIEMLAVMRQMIAEQRDEIIRLNAEVKRMQDQIATMQAFEMLYTTKIEECHKCPFKGLAKS